MPVKLLSESMDATITDEDQSRIEAILSFWFKETLNLASLMAMHMAKNNTKAQSKPLMLLKLLNHR